MFVCKSDKSVWCLRVCLHVTVELRKVKSRIELTLASKNVEWRTDFRKSEKQTLVSCWTPRYVHWNPKNMDIVKVQNWFLLVTKYCKYICKWISAVRINGMRINKYKTTSAVILRVTLYQSVSNHLLLIVFVTILRFFFFWTLRYKVKSFASFQHEFKFFIPMLFQY